jgi:hypothetical protein
MEAPSGAFLNMTIQNNSDELFAYLVLQQSSGAKNWFCFPQQRITGIYMAYEIAKAHADKMTPEEVASYAFRLNNAIHAKLIKSD